MSPIASARPLKCKLCSRRFKYAICMKDHLEKDHTAELIVKMKQAYVRRMLRVNKLLMQRQIQLNQTVQQPVRVSVIKPNGNNFGAFVAV